MVTPGVWRRYGGGNEECFFGNTLSPDVAMGSNNYLRYVTGNDSIQFDNVDQLVTFFCSNDTYKGTDIFDILCRSLNPALRKNHRPKHLSLIHI